MKKNNTSSGFSIIEVLIGIFIFSLGLISIYALLVTSLRVNDYNNNAIIASNLAREQIELFRNIRDTNYKKLQVWNQLEPETSDFGNTFIPNTYYTLENDIFSGNIKVENKGSSIPEGKNELADMQISYGLCLNNNNYTYDCSSSGSRKSIFYRYLYILELEPEVYKVSSKVIWYKRGYHEYEIETIVADWRRI